MCFSAAASIGVGAVLSGLGAVTLLKAKIPAHYPLAAIPAFFAIQQLTEGVLWLSLTHSGWEAYHNISTYLFLLIGQVLWPVWLPAAFIFFEKDKKRRSWMKIFLVTGIMVACYFLYCLFTFPVNSTLKNNHIFYDLAFPMQLVPVAAFFYVISTAVPPLLSGDNRLKWVGVFIILFYIITRIMFQPNLISVWCFFSSVISFFIFWVIIGQRKTAFAGV